MDIVHYGEFDRDQWDHFCEAGDGAWFYHRWEWMTYQSIAGHEQFQQNVSFMVQENGKLLAAVPLFLESIPVSDQRVLSAPGDGGLSPALANELGQEQRLAALRAALAQIDEIAATSEVTSVTMRVTPLAANFNRYLPDFLAATTRAGYLDRSSCSQVLNLTLSREQILAGMSKGHRSDVRHGRERIDVTVLDKNKISHDDFVAYQKLHELAAGRITRPPETFELMEKWIRDGLAVLVRAQMGGENAGFALILTDRKSAYYASGANNPEVATEPIGHVMQAATIDWLQDSGYTQYELGTQVFGNLPYLSPSSKELSIARFKRGFGGSLVPLVIRRKTY